MQPEIQQQHSEQNNKPHKQNQQPPPQHKTKPKTKSRSMSQKVRTTNMVTKTPLNHRQPPLKRLHLHTPIHIRCRLKLDRPGDNPGPITLHPDLTPSTSSNTPSLKNSILDQILRVTSIPNNFIQPILDYHIQPKDKQARRQEATLKGESFTK